MVQRMMIFLSKFLPLFVYPLGLACLIILAVLLIVRQPGWQRALLIVALLALWLGGNRWVAMGLARSLEWRYLPPDPIPQAQVIVLLGGGTQSASYPRSMVEVNNAGDRVLYAAWLYRQGVAEYILLSGGSLGWSAEVDPPAQQMAALLEMMGVPSEALWLEPVSRNTYENARYSARILRERGVRRILLVTSASHMPRSVRLFEAQGFEVIPLPTDYTVTVEEWQALWRGSLESHVLGLLPTASGLALTTQVLKEYMGMLVYDLRGWE
jgi:uncharacterized SAM-binding protein YcdF (DUF218 family)